MTRKFTSGQRVYVGRDFWLWLGSALPEKVLCLVGYGSDYYNSKGEVWIAPFDLNLSPGYVAEDLITEAPERKQTEIDLMNATRGTP